MDITRSMDHVNQDTHLKDQNETNKFIIMKKLILTFYALFFVTLSYAGEGQIEMADTLRQNGKIYVVVTVLSVIFAGIIVYLAMLDRKVTKLEKEMKNN